MADNLPLMNVRTFLRGGYALATVPTTVISRALVVGTWYPAGTEGSDEGTVRAVTKATAPAMGTRVPIAGMTQAERDKVLRRVGKT